MECILNISSYCHMQIWCRIKKSLVTFTIKFPTIKMTILSTKLHMKHCYIMVANIRSKLSLFEDSSNDTYTDPWMYSLAYNMGYMLPSTLLVAVLGLLLQSRLEKIKK